MNLKSKIPELREGMARSAMQQLLFQIKRQRGLTSFIQHRGVNGKWLNPEKPYDISVSKFFKIMKIKAHYQDEDEFLNDWYAAGKRFLNLVRMNQKED